MTKENYSGFANAACWAKKLKKVLSITHSVTTDSKNFSSSGSDSLLFKKWL